MCGSSDVHVVTCSGASNVGQIANQAAIQLAKEKVAGFFCLAGVGAHIKGMVKSAKEAGLMVAIDGCPVQCATKTLQHAEIEPAIQIVVTELGIEKSHEIAVDKKYSSIVVEKVKEEIGYRPPEATTCLNRGEKVYDYKAIRDGGEKE
ncbi:MAG: putative zinc-binding protein [Methanothrix sp.]|nr:putative zinc-binding protein [Methanothrix sp.]